MQPVATSRRRIYIPPKLQLISNGLHGDISQKMEPFINHCCEDLKSCVVLIDFQCARSSNSGTYYLSTECIYSGNLEV
jgi:hypothetical protein